MFACSGASGSNTVVLVQGCLLHVQFSNNSDCLDLHTASLEKHRPIFSTYDMRQLLVGYRVNLSQPV